MELTDAISKRHSTRDFLEDDVPREMLERLVSAGSMAPSSLNEQPWRFFVATGETRARLGKLIAQATIHLSEYMDVLGPNRYEDAVHWYSSLGQAPALIAVASPFTEDALAKLNRHLSVGAAIENVLLAAVDEGLGACNITFSHWVEDEIAELLGLPDDWDVLTVVAIGWPGEVPPAAPPHRADDAVWLD
ncbi:MAG: nitroreductase family protein [Coriobacteriia bacterium]|nr:nitroreductase family protein [Coriobacteriia bacterium]